MPALEAMACGTPVITSTASSLPEVVGDAARLVDPGDADGLAATMAHLLGSREQREQMQVAGLAQANKFSWERTAIQTTHSFRHALLPAEGSQGV